MTLVSKKNEFSKLSIELTSSLDKSEKKQHGIFFTPPKTISNNLDIISPYLSGVEEVLEPSCGSCEFITELKRRYNNMRITGIEYNKTIFERIQELEGKLDGVKLLHADFISHTFDKKYDLIIGNPPYSVMKKKDVSSSYYDYFEGRPNIFILFIVKALGLLNDDGILSFVLPKSFLNCLYYDKTRKFINENFKILNIVNCHDQYIETQQETVLLVVQKSKENSCNKNYLLLKEQYTIFSNINDVKTLNCLYDNSTTLNNLGFSVSVGTVVWNQSKDILTTDSSKTLLIYNSDIKDGKVVVKSYTNEDKKNYINKEGITEPQLVINRGHGVGNYTFNYCIVNENENESREFLVENHLIVVKPMIEFTREELIHKYKKIVKSFEDNRTKKFINLYFGNNAINTVELCNLLPIYVSEI